MSGQLHDQTTLGALGRLPVGRYLMTAGFEGQRSGMLVSAVQCCSTEPLLLCIAARKGHKIDPLIRDSRTFAIGIIPDDDKMIVRRFSDSDAAPSEHGPARDDDPFDAMATRTLVTGAPIVPRCETWFDCEMMRRVDLESECELFVGMVVAVYHDKRVVKIDPITEASD